MYALIVMVSAYSSLCFGVKRFDCPNGHIYLDSNEEKWCLKFSVISRPGLDFDEASSFCSSQGATLPILNNEKTYTHIEIAGPSSSFWIGVRCKADADIWEWQDGTPIKFKGVNNPYSNTLDRPCDFFSSHFALVNNRQWQAFDKNTQFTSILCFKRPMEIEDIVEKSPDSTNWTFIILVSVGGLLTLGVVCAITVLVRSKILEFLELRKTVKIQAARDKHAAMVSDLARRRRDEWEIQRAFVMIDREAELGKGAFGVVFRGRVLEKNMPEGKGRSMMETRALKMGRNDTYVAVKTMRESAYESEVEEFRKEIGIMTSIGYHENLVNMLCCVTQSDPPLLVLELCEKGDLLKFMKDRKEYMLNHEGDKDIGKAKVIDLQKKLTFAMQIAYGLEFLSSRGFVHRDVAARNILLDSNEICKEDWNEEREHHHVKGVRLPIKWMALEAIARNDYSPASDVWSFGVLLFEIITLGGVPYADWHLEDLLKRLKKGERMGRHSDCSDEMLYWYSLMNYCWRSDPLKRPDFSTVRRTLAVQMEKELSDYYPYLEPIVDDKQKSRRFSLWRMFSVSDE